LILVNDALFGGNLFTSESTAYTYLHLLAKPSRRWCHLSLIMWDLLSPIILLLAMDWISRRLIVTYPMLSFITLSTTGERMLRNCHRAVAYDMLETDIAALLDATPPDSVRRSP
jgi:hypothetical protein